METSTTFGSASDGPCCCALIGAGRMGSALAVALPAAGIAVAGPLRRGQPIPAQADSVLLCVPDAAIGEAAARLPVLAGRPVGHCSGATGLSPIAAAGHDAFSVHPLMTVTGADATFTGAGAAIDGTSPTTLALAERLAAALGMRAVRIGEDDRAAYHAAASIASNFLVTLEDAAELLLATTGALATSWSRSSAPPSRTGRPRAASAPSRVRSPAAMRQPSPFSATPWRRGPPSCSISSTHSPMRPARSPSAVRPPSPSR